MMLGVVTADAEENSTRRSRDLDVSDRHRVTSRSARMFAITHDVVGKPNARTRGVDGTRAAAMQVDGGAALLDLECHSFTIGAIAGGCQLVGPIDHRAVAGQVLGREQLPQLFLS